MMVPQASEKCGLLPPDHQQIGCSASNGINSGQAHDTFSTSQAVSEAQVARTNKSSPDRELLCLDG